MNNDELLKKMAQTMNERDKLVDDAYWEALAKGEAENDSHPLKNHEEFETLQQLFKPISDESKASFVDSILELNQAAPAANQSEASAENKVETNKAPSLSVGQKLQQWWSAFKNNVSMQAGLGFAFASILAVAFIVQMPQHRAVGSLPEYELAWSSQQASFRSSQTKSKEPRLLKSKTNSITLRPETAHRKPLKAFVFFENNGDWIRWEAKTRQSTQGSFQVYGKLPADMPDGNWQAHIVLTLENTALTFDSVEQQLKAAKLQDDKVRYFRQAVIIE